MIYEPNKCPIRFGLGVFGDRWSLLIIRDMMFRGCTRFQQFLDAGEGISTNVLTDRLSQLEAQQIISRTKDPSNGRRILYSLTDKGKDLLPVMLSIMQWSEQYDPKTVVSKQTAERLRSDFDGLRREWLEMLSTTGNRVN